MKDPHSDKYMIVQIMQLQKLSGKNTTPVSQRSWV